MSKFFINNKFFYLFYRFVKILRNLKSNKHFAEFGEDIFVRRFFKNFSKGIYVDIGAYHPFKGSLTLDLYKKKWRGINIDLSKVTIDLFKLARPKDINFRAAITDFDGKTFYYENSPINQQNSLTENNDSKKIEIDCYKLNTVLELYNVLKIDYLNIDAEGQDYKVISTFNFQKYKPSLISIEFNNYNFHELQNSNINLLMEKNNFKIVSKFGVTCFYVHRDTVEKIGNIMAIN